MTISSFHLRPFRYSVFPNSIRVTQMQIASIVHLLRVSSILSFSTKLFEPRLNRRRRFCHRRRRRRLVCASLVGPMNERAESKATRLPA